MIISEPRQILRGEIPRCAEIVRTGFLTVAEELSLSPETSPRFTGFSISADRLFYQFDVEKRPMFCCEVGGEIVGYCSLSPVRNGRAEINNLAVLPDFRHFGIGGRLLRHALMLAAAAGAAEAVVSIVDDNLRLRRWYEANGFHYVKSKKFPGFAFTCGEMIRPVGEKEGEVFAARMLF